MDTDKGWLLPQECFPDGTPEEWSDSTYRLALKSSVDYQLKELLRMTKSEKLHIAVLRAMLSLNTYFDVNERVIQRHEGQRGWDRFRLLHRQLSGLASEFYALAAACPESGNCSGRGWDWSFLWFPRRGSKAAVMCLCFFADGWTCVRSLPGAIMTEIPRNFWLMKPATRNSCCGRGFWLSARMSRKPRWKSERCSATATREAFAGI